jgi:hypothetical protein
MFVEEKFSAFVVIVVSKLLLKASWREVQGLHLLGCINFRHN